MCVWNARVWIHTCPCPCRGLRLMLRIISPMLLFEIGSLNPAWSLLMWLVLLTPASSQGWNYRWVDSHTSLVFI